MLVGLNASRILAAEVLLFSKECPFGRIGLRHGSSVFWTRIVLVLSIAVLVLVLDSIFRNGPCLLNLPTEHRYDSFSVRFSAKVYFVGDGVLDTKDIMNRLSRSQLLIPCRAIDSRKCFGNAIRECDISDRQAINVESLIIGSQFCHQRSIRVRVRVPLH